ncbi:hypothetical protein [Burkholderia phage BCSR5]|nr:hypothetical protein [Burkholderia phage BCSR5]
MSDTQNILKVVDDLVLQKTLTVEAAEGLVKLRERVKSLEAANESLKASLTESQRENADYKGRLDRTIADLRVLQEKESSVREREAKVTELERKAAVAQAEASAYLTSMKIVFAPNIVRESVQKWGSVAGPNGMSIPTSDGGTVNRAEGYEQPGSAAGSSGPHGGVDTKL